LSSIYKDSGKTMSATQARDAEIHRLIAGALCLDFANTLNGHRGQVMHEYLLDYRDLVLWSRHAGVLADDEASTLLDEAARSPAEAQAALDKAYALRERSFRVFSALAGGASPSPDDIAALNAARVEALSQSRLVPAGEGFALAWAQPASLERPLWAVALSAADLLVSEDVRRVSECDGQGCDWLFIDSSRNHLRRWCTMDQCGNRAKMRRRYARTSQRGSAAGNRSTDEGT
jgi:predicted RNA-binding Zn ribbon-like protein